MPRPASRTPEQIVDAALHRFWLNGYAATSVDDLVSSTGTTRHAMYQAFGGKRGLFLACLDAYPAAGVTPAFERVERPGATVTDIAAFLEHQIAAAEAIGLPGPGCFYANTMTEVAPHDPEVAERIERHHERLKQGFLQALRHSASADISEAELVRVAELLVVSAQGLWSASRAVTDAAVLRRAADTLIQLVQRRIGS